MFFERSGDLPLEMVIALLSGLPVLIALLFKYALSLYPFVFERKSFLNF